MLYSSELSRNVIEIFEALVPLNDYFHDIVQIEEIAKALEREAKSTEISEPEINMVKAPETEFMW